MRSLEPSRELLNKTQLNYNFKVYETVKNRNDILTAQIRIHVADRQTHVYLE